jgi:predicted GIY-YIG superfamily endonuclease
MTAKEKRAALNAVRKLERQLGVGQFGWAVRKHMAIEQLKRQTKRRLLEMKKEIAQLTRRIA